MYPQPQNVLKAQTTDYLGYYYAKPVFCLKICLRYAASVFYFVFRTYLLAQAILPKLFSFFAHVLLYLSENIFLSNFPALFNSFGVVVLSKNFCLALTKYQIPLKTLLKRFF